MDMYSHCSRLFSEGFIHCANSVKTLWRRVSFLQYPQSPQLSLWALDTLICVAFYSLNLGAYSSVHTDSVLSKTFYCVHHQLYSFLFHFFLRFISFRFGTSITDPYIHMDRQAIFTTACLWTYNGSIFGKCLKLILVTDFYPLKKKPASTAPR
jgi:hypothetical protein